MNLIRTISMTLGLCLVVACRKNEPKQDAALPEDGSAQVAVEPTPEEKMHANALSYKLLVLERGFASCDKDIPVVALQAPCKEAVNECAGKAELAFRRGDAAEGSLGLAAQE